MLDHLLRTLVPLFTRALQDFSTVGLTMSFTTSTCAKCNKPVGHGADCKSCLNHYHFACCGISERGYVKLGGVGRSTWTCPPCREASNKSHVELDDSVVQLDTASNSASCPDEKQKSPNASSQMADILAKLNDIANLHSDLKELKRDMVDLKEIKNDIAELKATYASNMDELFTRVNSIEDKVDEVDKLKLEIQDLKKSLHNISDEQRKNDQWVRRSNILINGIPQKANENLVEILKKLAAISGFSLNVDTDIDFVTRVAVGKESDQKKPRPIVVKMQARFKKDEFMAATRKLKNLTARDLGFPGTDQRIYVNDHLSPYNRFLFQQAKIKAKEKGYTFWWVRNCTVMVRREPSSPVIHVTSLEALNKIV